MFTSDNGPHKEGGHDPNFWDSNGPLTGTKRSLTEGGVRVPFMVRWPAKIKAGSTSDHISAFWDFFPTACELAGAKIPDGLDGKSFVPTLLGKPQKAHDYLYWEFFEQGGKRAVRFGKWKGLQLNVHKDPNGPIKLYNLEEDIGETKNLAEQYPEMVSRVKTYFQQAHSESEFWKFKTPAKKKK